MINKSGGGIGFAGLLTLIFIALKLTSVISWSWLWVLSPLWIGAIVAVIGAALFVLGLTFLGALLYKIIENLNKVAK